MQINGQQTYVSTPCAAFWLTMASSVSKAILPALRMSDQNIARTERSDHPGRDLPGIRAFFSHVHILRAHADSRTLYASDNRWQINRWREDRDLRLRFALGTIRKQWTESSRQSWLPAAVSCTSSSWRQQTVYACFKHISRIDLLGYFLDNSQVADYSFLRQTPYVVVLVSITAAAG